MLSSRGLYISYRPVPAVDSRYIEPRSSGYRPRTSVLYIDYRPGDRSITYTYIYIYMYIRIAFSIELRLRVSRSLRSLAKYSEISIELHLRVSRSLRSLAKNDIPLLRRRDIPLFRGRN